MEPPPIIAVTLGAAQCLQGCKTEISMRIFWTKFFGKTRCIVSALRREDRRVVRLTDESLRRIALGHTPISEWPEVDENIFAHGTFDEDSSQVKAEPPADAHAHV